MTRRYSSDLMIDSSYVLSKMFTDSGSMWGSGAAISLFNRRLEKALSAYDRTHEAEINYVYELPIGPGKEATEERTGVEDDRRQAWARYSATRAAFLSDSRAPSD